MGAILPFLITALILLILGSVMLVANRVIAPRRPDPRKYIPYECGVDPSGPGWVPFHVRFYLIALIFLVFDVEVVFLYPWAVIFEELSWFGFVEITIFVVMLLLAYVYAWSEGALQWE